VALNVDLLTPLFGGYAFNRCRLNVKCEYFVNIFALGGPNTPNS